MKITLLEITNFKRLKAVRMEPSAKGLTVIGGRNAQGKTSVLDGIVAALGNKRRLPLPTSLKRDGALAPTTVRLETDSGLVVERKGKNFDLTVTDPTGHRDGQGLLDQFVSDLALDLPRFFAASDREKADMLLQSLGIGEQVAELDREIKSKFDTRTATGRLRDQKKKAAEDMPYHDGLPDEPVSVQELIDAQQEILSRNGVKQRLAQDLESNKRNLASYKAQLAQITKAIDLLEKQIAAASSHDLTLEPTDELKRQIAEHEETNRLIAENAAKRVREEEATDLADQYDALTEEIESLRGKKYALLKSKPLPFPGLSVNDDGLLTLDGKAWDCMSGSQQLIIGSAIASRINPECRFVLLDKLEQLDLNTLKEFDEWLVANDLQCIATRVSSNSDGECSLVIEDGEVKGESTAPVTFKKNRREKAAPSAQPETGLSDDDF